MTTEATNVSHDVFKAINKEVSDDDCKRSARMTHSIFSASSAMVWIGERLKGVRGPMRGKDTFTITGSLLGLSITKSSGHLG